MRRVNFLLLFSCVAACVTTRNFPLHSSADGEALARDLRGIHCQIATDRIFRASVFKDDALLFLADVETDVSSASAGATSGSLVVRAETMEEMLRVFLDQNLDVIGGRNFAFGGRSVVMEKSSVTVDRDRIPVGPGEIACLMGGSIPRQWVDAPRMFWNPAGKAIEFDDGRRQVSLSREPGGHLKIKISWATSWFSKSSIHVTMSNAKGGEPGTSGTMQAPGGYSVRWIEI